jgi:tRNA threonylcarbamoyladenosine biosynthesis protein TsaB
MNNNVKAVRAYRRNLSIALGLILLVFILIPVFVKSPYVLNVFVLVFYMSTLSMAWNLLGREGVVCCAMDARRQQVYNALFRMGESGPERLTQDRAISLEALFREESMKGALLVGDGAQLCREYAQSAGISVNIAPENLRFQHAYGVARAALEHYRAGARGTGADLAANYLRLSQAERERLEREKQAKNS